MAETSGSATEEGSLSQDGQACNRCHMIRTERQKLQFITYIVCGLSRRLIALLPVPVSYATVSGHAQYQSPRTSSPQ